MSQIPTEEEQHQRNNFCNYGRPAYVQKPKAGERQWSDQSMTTSRPADQMNQLCNLCFNAARAYVKDWEAMSGHMTTLSGQQARYRPHICYSLPIE